MNWRDAEDLAIAVLCLDEDTTSSEIEDYMYDKFEISMEQFHKVADALMLFTIPAKSALSGELFQGFVNDGSFICKQLANKDEGE